MKYHFLFNVRDNSYCSHSENPFRDKEIDLNINYYVELEVENISQYTDITSCLYDPDTNTLIDQENLEDESLKISAPYTYEDLESMSKTEVFYALQEIINDTAGTYNDATKLHVSELCSTILGGDIIEIILQDDIVTDEEVQYCIDRLNFFESSITKAINLAANTYTENT
jgi:hypothetical protein